MVRTDKKPNAVVTTTRITAHPEGGYTLSWGYSDESRSYSSEYWNLKDAAVVANYILVCKDKFVEEGEQ